MPSDDYFDTDDEGAKQKFKTLLRRHAAGNVNEQEASTTWGYEFYRAKVKFTPDLLAALKDNVLPPPTTLQSATSLKEDVVPQVAAFDAEIEEIDQQMAYLKLKKEKLWADSATRRTQLLACNMVLSPIRRIPDDVLLEIAQWALPTHQSGQLLQCPINMAQVCSSWRTVLDSMPSLWSTLCVTVKMGPHWYPAATKVNGFFSRSQGHPLSLFLNLENHIWDQPCDHRLHKPTGDITPDYIQPLQNFLQQISAWMPRLRRLGLQCDGIGYYWNGLKPASPPWSFDALEYLYISNSTSEECDFLPTLLAPRSANRLRSVSIHGITLVEPRSLDPLASWSALTELRLSKELGLSTWRALLKLCPRLASAYFTLYVDTPSLEEMAREPPRSHPLVALDLCILCDEGATATAIFSHCHFPAARKLRLSSEWQSGPPEDSWTPSLPPSSPFDHLRFLSIEHMAEGPDHYLRILEAATNLEELVLLSSEKLNILACILAGLALEAPRSEWPTRVYATLPRLVVLQLPASFLRPIKIDGVTITIHTDAFAHMLQTRRPSQVPLGVQPLREVRFTSRSGNKTPSPRAARHAGSCVSNFEEKVADCREEGLKISLGINPEGNDIDGTPIHPFDGPNWKFFHSNLL